MKQNILNWYKLRNVSELNMQYRLIRIELDEFPDDPKLNNKNWNLLLIGLARDTRGPVSTIYFKGKKYIAIDASKSISQNEIQLVPSNATIHETDITGHLDFNNLNKDTHELAKSFLDFSIRSQLTQNFDLWKFSNSSFLKQKPLFLTKPSETDIYPGFNYKLVIDSYGDFYIILDLAYKYADSQTISQRINGMNLQAYKKLYNGQRALYQNGHNWYIVEVKGFGRPIYEQTFTDDSKESHIVLDYILKQEKEKYGKIISPIERDCKALLYTYPHQSKVFNGASCLARLIHSADDAGQAGIHNKSINEPTERFHHLSTFLKQYFNNLRFNNVRLDISNQPLNETMPKFYIPNIKYPSGEILNPSEKTETYGSNLVHFPKLRKRFLYKNGILNNRFFEQQYILFPESLSIEFAKSFKYNLLQPLKQLAPKFEDFILIPYKDISEYSAFKQFKEIEKSITQYKVERGAVILILPDHQIESNNVLKNLHDCVKKQFFPKLRFQCASSNQLSKFLKPSIIKNGDLVYSVSRKEERIFSSYLNYLIFELLLINYRWPYCLANNLNYDIYIGIDAHDYYAGFCFFYKNGEHIAFDYSEVPKKTGTFRNEKISSVTIKKVLLENLKRHIPLHAENPNGIIILRDGRSFGEEEKALNEVIEELSTFRILDSNKIKKAVIDVNKRSVFSVRAARITNDFTKYKNVNAGKYKLLNEKEAFLFNTGFPFNIPGSSNPLHITQTFGNAEFIKILEDIFHQTILAYSAPDRPNSLPVTLKIVDTLIRSFAHQISDLALEQSDEVEIENYEKT